MLVTTDAVLLELLAAFSASGQHLRQHAGACVEEVIHHSNARIIEMTLARFLDGLALYKARADKSYSLTDCISMRVMRQEGLTDILTNDRHFAQEGFTVVFG